MVGTNVEFSLEPGETFSIALDPNRPRPWSKITAEARSFARCTNHCFGPAKELDPLVELKQIMAEQKRRYPRNQVGAKLNQHSESQFDIMSLPGDIFLRIFDWLVEPYELKVYLLVANSGKNRSHILIPHPRTWKSIPFFRVSRLFRNLAIKHYGLPSQESLPFNPAMDSLIVLRTAWLERPDPVTCSALDFVCQHLEQKSKNPVPQNRWLKENIICHYETYPPSSYGVSRADRLRPEFLQRVHHAEIVGPEKLSVHNVAWSHAIRYLSATMPHLKHLGISIRRYDRCKGGPGVSLNHVYKKEYLDIFDGFDFSSRKDLHGPDAPRVFPLLRCLQVSRRENKCSLEFECDLGNGLPLLIGRRG